MSFKIIIRRGLSCKFEVLIDKETSIGYLDRIESELLIDEHIDFEIVVEELTSVWFILQICYIHNFSHYNISIKKYQ